MFSTLSALYLLEILGVQAGFQDGIAPRAPQADTTGDLPPACATVDYALSFCDSAIPGFSTLDPTDQASCFCYSSTAWVPDAFDGAVFSCAQYAATALPESAYSNLVNLEGFCSAVGDVEAGNGPAAVSATTTPGAAATVTGAAEVDIFTNPACSAVGSALSFCNSVSPGFTTMDPTSQAPCLCYSSTAWVPDDFDGAVLTCAEYVSSAAPTSLSLVTGLEGFCSDVGNVLGGASPGAIGTPSATNTMGGQTTPRTSKPGVAATIATPVATTIESAPTTSTQSSRSSRMHNDVWGLGLFAVAASLLILD